MMREEEKEKKVKWSHFKTKISVYLGIKPLGIIGQSFRSDQIKLHSQRKTRNTRPADITGTADAGSSFICSSHFAMSISQQRQSSVHSIVK